MKNGEYREGKYKIEANRLDKKTGLRPIHWACQGKDLRFLYTVGYLIEHCGVDYMTETAKGLTCVDFCGGFQPISMYIQEFIMDDRKGKLKKDKEKKEKNSNKTEL